MLVLWALLVLEGTIGLHVQRLCFAKQQGLSTTALDEQSRALFVCVLIQNPSHLSQSILHNVIAGTQYD